ncbi:MAG: hypothetical protein IT359_12020 [Gemmatimonadaceae bacterium]|nr:hypothetical protein [Gemmatimonadaceae bacterium]
MAASQCPRCTHPLNLRDSRGEPVPLAHCRSCDTYYPRSRGGCKWCGTTAPPVVNVSLAAIGGVVAVVALLGIGTWQFFARRGGSESRGGEAVVAAKAPASVAPEQPGAVAPPAVGTPLAATDSTRPDSLLQTAVSTAPTAQPALHEPAPLPPVTAPPGQATPAPSSQAAAAAMRPGGAAAPPSASATQPATSAPPVPPQAIPTGPSAADRYAGPWSRAVALEWVNVRGTPAREAAVVGVVTPNTRVLLGDVKAGWRRVRAVGFEGWADARYFAADSVRR